MTRDVDSDDVFSGIAHERRAANILFVFGGVRKHHVHVLRILFLASRVQQSCPQMIEEYTVHCSLSEVEISIELPSHLFIVYRYIISLQNHDTHELP